MKAQSIRIASYNLQKCVGLDLRRRPDRSLQVIADLVAPVVVLQEADKRLPPRPAALPHEMAEAQGWQVVDFGEPAGSLGFHGNAMLIRPDIGVLTTAHIDLPGLEPRGAIRADLATAIGPLRVIGTHLGLIRRYRLLQLRAIMRHLSQLSPMPTVLAGDFNEWGPARALDNVTPGLLILPERPSFPSPRPVAPLDRFAISGNLVARNHGTHSARPARVASDHLPVWADLTRR
ncbi:MAG: Metal-dependent hydrolase [Rhodobacteraceae bacterium HLUCCO07]|uniref:endonuclease/exonuclease/phosphatase family protein n=1 Tax=Aquicoccus sp. TaxID=2055851 RepID=UPI0006D9C4CA|nr:MAG: Metal-dependent hydrolase [Rhodobacteraceae bacterium HLUCCO07]